MRKQPSNRRWAYLFVNISTLLWASNIVLGRALRDDIGPVTLTAARFIIAGMLFLGLLLINKKSWVQPTPRDWLRLIGMALTGVFGFPILMYLALRYTTATNAVLINASTPLVTVFLAALILKERITKPLIVGSIFSIAGVIIVISNGSLKLLAELRFNVGDVIVLINVGLWGMYSILGRLVTRQMTSLTATAYSAWLALPLLMGSAALEFQNEPTQVNLSVILAALYIGIFPSVIAFVAWNEGVRRVGPNQAMAFYNMLPLYGILLGVVLLGETLTWMHILGGALVVSGGLAVAFSEKPHATPIKERAIHIPDKSS